jgi:hypothetical protein
MTSLLKLLDKNCSFTTFFIAVVVVPVFVIAALAAMPFINL